MKNYTAKTISLLTGFAVAAISCISMICLNCFATGAVHVLLMVLLPLGFGIATFFVLRQLLQKFIVEQIKPIYGTLGSYSNNSEDLKLKPEVDGSENINNIITQVNDEVAKWAKDKTREISILKASEKYRKEYLGNVSHELKTPLFNIQGYITTLVDGGLDDEQINMKYLERAEKNITRLISIVQDLETISKFETGNLKLNFDTFDVAQVVEEIFDLYEMKAKAKNITLKPIFKAKPPVMVTADKTRIFEVISNLVVNSINYGRENGCTSVGIYDIESKWLIEVEDNGIGIDEENLQRVFERFFRVDKSRSSQNGGTGLGLAIVKHILEAHGERITVKSKINEGTTFSFTLKKAEK